MQQLHRHRIEHLVADDHAGHRIGQRVEPAHALAERRERLALALPQRARQVDDAVALHPLAQGPQQLRGQRARAGAEFPDLGGAVASSACCTWHASAAPNSGLSSGAVTKSLPDAGMVPNWRLPRA